jgi:phosphoglycolate phosphatase-like HAD superfamily hydrolase
MNLAIFDIDGTLTQTSKVDDLCFHKTVLRELLLNDFVCNWSEFSHATDSCIFTETFKKELGRLPNTLETERFQECFLNLIKESYQTNPEYFLEVPGAQSAIQFIRTSKSWAVAIASGGWRRSAQFKLNCIGINPHHFPSAFANDGISREEIVLTSIQRSLDHYAVPRFDKMVYIGDGLWDAKTCHNLGIPFIGVSTRLSKETLQEAGAFQILPHYEPSSELINALEADSLT